MEQRDGESAGIVNNSDDVDDNGIRSWRRITNIVELPLALMFFSITLGGAAIGNLLMYRTCVHALGHPVSECHSFLDPEDINHSEELEKEVQKYSAFVGTVKSVLEALGPAVLSLFLGGWSDKHGRKPILVWSLFGMTMSGFLTVLYSMMGSLGPWWIILTVIPFSLTGGFMVHVIAAMCYISDISPENKKAITFMMMQGTITISMALGGLLSSHLLKAVGIVYLLFIYAALNTVAYAFTNVFIKESLKESEQGNILTVFDFSHVKNMVKTCFKKKPNYGRAILLLIIGASTLSVFAVYGISGLVYMYTRAKIGWTMRDYTTFMAISTVIAFVGTAFGIAVMQRKLRISDLNFFPISFSSSVGEYIIKGLATQTWHMYFGSLVSMFGNVSGPLVRSFLAKTIPPDEIAKVFGMMGCADALTPLLAPVVYNALYAATIFTFPASVMYLTASIYAVCLCLIGVAIYLKRRSSVSTGYQEIQTEET